MEDQEDDLRRRPCQRRRQDWVSRRELFQARGLLVVVGIAHARRCLLPTRGCPTGLPHRLLEIAEVAQGRTLAVPVAGFPEDRRRVLETAEPAGWPMAFGGRLALVSNVRRKRNGTQACGPVGHYSLPATC